MSGEWNCSCDVQDKLQDDLCEAHDTIGRLRKNELLRAENKVLGDALKGKARRLRAGLDRVVEKLRMAHDKIKELESEVELLRMENKVFGDAVGKISDYVQSLFEKNELGIAGQCAAVSLIEDHKRLKDRQYSRCPNCGSTCREVCGACGLGL